MFLYLFVKLQEGDLCKVTCRQSKWKDEIVRFKQMDYYLQAPCFVFETLRHERVVLCCESEFEMVPYEGSLQFLIDLALQTRDREWFDELVYKLKYESETKGKSPQGALTVGSE